MKKVVEEFEYQGYMSQEAQKFFEGKLITEERGGCAVVGSFVKLANGNNHLPNKNDKFKKYEDGSITVSSMYR